VPQRDRVSSFDLQIWGDERRDAWRAFIAEQPYGDLLQTMEWGALKARSGWEPLPLAAVESNRQVAAALLLKRTLPQPFRALLYCPRGPILDWRRRELVHAVLEAIREQARRHEALFAKFDPAVPAKETNVSELLREHACVPACGEPEDDGGFGGVQPRYVMKTNLTPHPDELLASFKSKTRYNIRLASRKGVVVKVDTTRHDLPEFYKLLQVTAERDRFLIRPQKYYEDLWELLVEPGLAHLFLGYYEQELIAGALCFILGHQCWYVYGASSNRHRQRMPNHLVQWTAMQWARERGCTVYDFRGVAPNTEQGRASPLYGLNRFKEGFAAELVEYAGEWDLPVRPLWYRAFRCLEPPVRRMRKVLARLRR